LVGRVTEHNFDETSKFVGQFSEFCATYPNAALSLAGQLRVEDESIRREFVSIASRIGSEHQRAGMEIIPGVSRAEHKHPKSTSVDQTASVDSPELKESLGQIRLATLPELAIVADFSDEGGRGAREQEGSEFESSEQSNSEFPGQTPRRLDSLGEVSRGSESTGPESRGPESRGPESRGPESSRQGLTAEKPADRATSRPPSGIVPRRTGVLLRR